MFDIGFSELLVLAVVALLVLGPERLPRAARFAGLWVRRARAQWYSVKSELESEFADDELKRSLQRTRDELRDVQDQLQAQGRDLQQQFEREREQIEQATQPTGQRGSPAAADFDSPDSTRSTPEQDSPDSTDPEGMSFPLAEIGDADATGSTDLDHEQPAPPSGENDGHSPAPSPPDADPAMAAKRPPASGSPT
ncbi:MAG: Sec-independent protein translocase protein TatB [Lysobacter sp.]